jgi:hypothetical protein
MRSIHADSSVGLGWWSSWTSSSRSRHAGAPGFACSCARTVCDDSCVGMLVHSFPTTTATAPFQDKQLQPCSCLPHCSLSRFAQCLSSIHYVLTHTGALTCQHCVWIYGSKRSDEVLIPVTVQYVVIPCAHSENGQRSSLATARASSRTAAEAPPSRNGAQRKKSFTSLAGSSHVATGHGLALSQRPCRCPHARSRDGEGSG